MTTTPENTAATWRDLADQLTPEQISLLEYCEREQVPPGIADAEHHLNHARMLTQQNLFRQIFADIEPPEAVGDVGEWVEWGDRYGRPYIAWERDVDGVVVSVDGAQFGDGRIELSIRSAAAEDMTVHQARDMALALVDADVAEVERLSGGYGR